MVDNFRTFMFLLTLCTLIAAVVLMISPVEAKWEREELEYTEHWYTIGEKEYKVIEWGLENNPNDRCVYIYNSSGSWGSCSWDR